jgi:hypothetical protein
MGGFVVLSHLFGTATFSMALFPDGCHVLNLHVDAMHEALVVMLSCVSYAMATIASCIATPKRSSGRNNKYGFHQVSRWTKNHTVAQNAT